MAAIIKPRRTGMCRLLNHGGMALAIAAAFAMLLASCGGGSDSADETGDSSTVTGSIEIPETEDVDGDGTAIDDEDKSIEIVTTTDSTPAINNAEYSNQPDVCVISVVLDFSDPGGDLYGVHTSLYDENDSMVGENLSPVDGITDKTSGIISGSLDFSFLPVGSYSLKILIVDSLGLESNLMVCEFGIEGGLGDAVVYTNAIETVSLGDTAMGDLNGDGLNDLAVIQYANDTGLLFVYYQNTSGGFDSEVTMTFDIRTSDVAIADVNNDGSEDLIVSGGSSDSGDFFAMLQDPDTGELQSPYEYYAIAYDNGNLSVGDLNEDKLNDVAIFGASKAALFFQEDDGLLGSQIDTAVRDFTDSWYSEGQIADMNNDGKNDILIRCGKLDLAIFKQISNGVFDDTPDVYTVQTYYWPSFGTYATGDLNADGLTDMVAIDPGGTGYINVFFQNDEGLLEDPVLIETTTDLTSVVVADITGDGLNDIVCDGITIFPQMSDHTFADSEKILTYNGFTNAAHGLSVGDVTGDGYLDAVVSDGNLIKVFPFEKQSLLY